jgi:flagellar protein FliO/FliZ
MTPALPTFAVLFLRLGRGLRLARAGIVLGILAATAAGAADDEKIIFPGTARSEPPAQGAATSKLNAMSLIVAVALAGVGGWMVLRHRRGVPLGRATTALAVEETRSLGNRQFLVVASYEGKKFLIGVCPGRIDMLAPLDGAAGGNRGSE